MPSFIFRKENQDVELTEELQAKLCSAIVANHKEYNKRRQQQKDDAKILIDQLDRDSIKEITFGQTVNTDDLFALKESFRANLRKYINENVENFDIQGRNEQSDGNKSKQKESLVYSIRQMNFKDEAESLVDNFCIWGEFITYTEWVTELRQIRRPLEQLEVMTAHLMEKIEAGKQLDEIEQSNIQTIMQAQEAGKEFAIILDEKYKGAKIKAIDPEKFVYDVHNPCFDAALKIEQIHTEYEALLDEQSYKLDDEAKEALKPKAETSEKENVINVENSTAEKESGQVELLQAMGDIRLSDGTLLKNYLIVVADGKHVIRFEPNPYLFNPYTIKATIKNYKTKRGVSLLSKALVHVLVSSFILSKMLDILALVQNPPSTGPKLANLDKGQLIIKPGFHFEQDEDLLAAGHKTEFLTHFAAALDPSFAFLDKFKHMMQEITGISNYMSGIEDNKDKRVGVANLEYNAQQIRLMMTVDDLQDFILKNVEKLAELNSNYEFGEKEVPINRDSGFDTLQIDDAVRQGSYAYDYTDKRNYFERRQEADQFVMGVEKFVAMGVPVEKTELCKDWLKTWDKKDVEKYIMSDEFDQMLESIPPVIETPHGQMPKEVIKQHLAQTLNQIMTQLTDPQGVMNAEQQPVSGIHSGM